MNKPARLAVVGAGLIGQRHVAAIQASGLAVCTAIVEPHPKEQFSVPVFSSLEGLLALDRPDGLIIATPTPLHARHALTAIDAGLPVLVEKPLTDTLEDAMAVVAAADAAGVPVLVGHHRRHNPLIQAAVKALKDGLVGDVRAVQATCWFYKPDHYFQEAPWRKQLGAGPVSVNLVHDIDLLRLFCGDVILVQAQTRPSRRGYENEDLAAAILQFDSGAIATLTVSDAIAAPWSWEMTSGENPIYPMTGQSCYLIGGSEGALSLPDLRHWRHSGAPDWWTPMTSAILPHEPGDPLVRQIAHFAAVIHGKVQPLVSARDGLRNIQVIDAIERSAISGTAIRLIPA